MMLNIAETSLSQLFTNSIYSRLLRISYPSGIELHSRIKTQTSRNLDDEIDGIDLWFINQGYQEFKIAFLAELGSLDSYLVTQKGSHDTYTLLNYGEVLFPSELANKIPEALADIREAAKCLAFELPTACGFHIFRATESVVRRYYLHVTAGAAPPKIRALGVYINALKQSGKADPKILAALKQMVDLHRNPLIHPEDSLTTEDALTILGLARSAVACMLAALPVIP